MPQRHKLVMEKFTELSLVDNPANQHASIVIAKRMDTTKPKFSERLTALGKRLLDAAIPPAEVQAELVAIGKDAETYEDAMNRPKIWEKFSAIEEVIRTVMDDADVDVEEKRTQIDAALSSFRDDILSVTKDAGTCPDCGATMVGGTCPKAANHGAKTTKAVDEPITEPPTPGAESMKKTAQTFTDIAKANEHIGTLTGEFNQLQDTLDTEVAKADPLAAITKGMTPAQAEIVKRDRERIAKLESDALDSRRITKVLSIFKGIISEDDAGRNAGMAVVKCLDGVASDAERATALEFVTKLAQQHAAVVKELDGMEIGGAGSQTDTEAGRAERLEKAARELMKTEKGLTFPAAVSKALDQDPTLYDEDADENDGGAQE